MTASLPVLAEVRDNSVYSFDGGLVRGGVAIGGVATVGAAGCDAELVAGRAATCWGGSSTAAPTAAGRAPEADICAVGGRSARRGFVGTASP